MRFYILDYVKYICALEIVFLHTVNNTKIDGYFMKVGVKYVVDCLPPVEMFFIISSFLIVYRCYSAKCKANDLDKKVGKYLKRLGLLYLCWAIFYIYDITGHWDGRSMFYNFGSLIKQLFFTGYSGHTWYMVSLIYGTIFVWFLYKKFGYIVMCNASAVLAVFCLSGSAYYFVLGNPLADLWIKLFGSMALVRAPIYISLGIRLAKDLSEGKIWNLKKNSIMWLLCVTIDKIERLLIYSTNLGLNEDITIMKPLVAYFAFKTAVALISKLESKVVFLQKISNTGEFLGRSSVVIYFSHIVIIHIVKNITGENIAPWWLFGITVISTSCIGVLLVANRKRKLCSLFC